MAKYEKTAACGFTVDLNLVIKVAISALNVTEYYAVISPTLYRAVEQTAAKEVTRPLPQSFEMGCGNVRLIHQQFKYAKPYPVQCAGFMLAGIHNCFSTTWYGTGVVLYEGGSLGKQICGKMVSVKTALVKDPHCTYGPRVVH